MTDNMRDFVKGLIPGLTGAPLPYTGTEPVAYLYNGVRLPKLPEVAGYALLCKRLGFYTVYFFDSYEFGANDSGAWQISIPSGNQMYQISGAEWTKQISTSARNLGYENILWADFDVIGPDDSVHLAASEPIPVYE